MVINIKQFKGLGEFFNDFEGIKQDEFELCLQIVDTKTKTIYDQTESPFRLEDFDSDLRIHGILASSVQKVETLQLPIFTGDKSIKSSLNAEENGLKLVIALKHKNNQNNTVSEYKSDELIIDTFSFEYPEKMQI